MTVLGHFYSVISSPAVILLVLVLLLAPYVISAARQQWIVYKALQKLPCDPDQHWLFGHAPKVVITSYIAGA